MVISFFSIFALLITPLLIVIFVRVISKHIQHKSSSWILGGYGVVLLLSVPVLYMIPTEKLINHEIVGQESLNQDKVSQEFYNAALKGRLDQVKGAFVDRQWSFEYNGDQLEVTGSNEEYYGTMIVAERKATNDGIIEVVHYTTQSIVGGIDVSKFMKSPQVTLGGNKLIITMPDPFEVEFIRFRKDFTVSQFLGNMDREMYDFDTGYSNGFGSQVLYIRIPQNVQMDETIYDVQFVSEEP